jgi:hypothetical protein
VVPDHPTNGGLEQILDQAGGTAAHAATARHRRRKAKNAARPTVTTGITALRAKLS